MYVCVCVCMYVCVYVGVNIKYQGCIQDFGSGGGGRIGEMKNVGGAKLSEL